MSLSKSDVESYRDLGFCVLRGAIEPQLMQSLRELLGGRVESNARELYRLGKISSLYEDQSFERRWARIHEETGDLKQKLWNLTSEFGSPTLCDLIRNPVILEALELLVGPEIDWAGDCVSRPKLPGHYQTNVPWHQDSQYFGPGTEHIDIITVWIPLVDVDEINGCLYVKPGSHHWGVLDGRREAGHFRTFEDVDKRGKSMSVPMKQGDILFLTNLTFHASGTNTTDLVRWSMDFRYLPSRDSKIRSKDESDGYDALRAHHRIVPTTVRSQHVEKIASLAGLRESAAQHAEQIGARNLPKDVTGEHSG